MAVSIHDRPLGFFSNLDQNAADTILDPTDGVSVIVRKSSHGLITGRYVYIKSDVEDYNGFWYVELRTVQSFYIKRHASADRQEYIRDTAQLVYDTMNSELFHTWSCVHLPIIYTLSNTLWPTNSADTTRTMTVTNSNGYCAIAASGDIKASGSAAALEYVNVTNAGDYNGVYQIISYTNDTTFVIDLTYSSAADTALTAGNIQYYYNNYVVKVRIYGGLSDSHHFNGQRPYTLLATKDIIPDNDNICIVEVGEILSKQITIRNNTLLGTLPNNLDAFTMFYIEYAEEYDDSDGTTLSRSTPSYTSDELSFEGFAANAMLPFKNVYSGILSEYSKQDSSQKFLTQWVRPTIFSGEYFDLSFINDEFTQQNISDVVNGSFASALTPWTNTGSGTDWVHASASAQVTVTSPSESKRLEQDYDFKRGHKYLIRWSNVVSSFDNTYTLVCYLTNDAYSATQSVGSLATTGNGTTYKAQEVTADANYTKIVFELNLNTP